MVKTMGVVSSEMAVTPSRNMDRRDVMRPLLVARLSSTNANSPTCMRTQIV